MRAAPNAKALAMSARGRVPCFSGNVTNLRVDPEPGIDLSYRFVEPRIEPRDGRAAAPAGPGLGIELDWSQIESIAVEKVEG